MAVWGGKPFWTHLPVDVSSALNSSIPMWRVQKGACVESGGWGYGWIFKWGKRSNHDSIIRWKEESLEKRNNKNNDTLQRFHMVITQSPFSSHYSASLTFLKMTVWVGSDFFPHESQCVREYVINMVFLFSWNWQKKCNGIYKVKMSHLFKDNTVLTAFNCRCAIYIYWYDIGLQTILHIF